MSVNRKSWGWHMPSVELESLRVGSFVADPNNANICYMVMELDAAGWVILERVV